MNVERIDLSPVQHNRNQEGQMEPTLSDESSPANPQKFSDQRRAALTLGVAGLAVLASTRSPAKTPSQRDSAKVKIRAPREGIILTLLNRPSVTENDVVIALDAAPENDSLAKLLLARGFLEDQEKALSDDQLKSARGSLSRDQGIADAYYKYANLVHVQEQQTQLPPPVTYEDLTTHNARQVAYLRDKAVLTRASADVERAKAALALFNDKVDVARAQLKRTKDALDARIAMLNQEIARLQLKAPVSGGLRTYGYVGGFVNQGDVVAEIF